MKANHIPVRERIRKRISKLYSLVEPAHVRIGRGNPYYHCRECGITDPELNRADNKTKAGNYKHYRDCRIAALQGQINYYENLLKEML